MMGSLQVTDTIEVQINGLFVMGLTLLITAGVALLLYKSRWGLQVRAWWRTAPWPAPSASTRGGSTGYTFGLGCGIAGIAGSAFTMIGSTGPTAGQLYIVDTFLVVVFGGAQSLLGTIASALHHLAVAVDAGVLPHRIDGQGSHSPHRHRHPDAATAGPLRPQGKKVTSRCPPCPPVTSIAGSN
jgi:branched-subunit amino acid ABC-type transport system permease component